MLICRGVNGCRACQEQGYSLPDWLVDTTSGATGATTDATEIEDGAPATADFAAHWAKSKHSEAYSKDSEQTFCILGSSSQETWMDIP